MVLGLVGDNFVTDNANSNKFLRYLFMLVPNISLKMGFNAILEFEQHGGLGFYNIFEMPNKFAPHPPMGCVLSMFIMECAIYLLIMWYVENVFPGEFGVGKPWYFPFTKSYWITNKISSTEPCLDEMDDCNEIEKVTKNLQTGIRIRNLHKHFGKKHVVRGFGLDIYQKQITVLLGHNGAGKTTTMNIITGITSPSKGTVCVNGYDVFKNMDTVRKNLGLCPQFNVQFTDLTVLEHLMFFAMLRGADKVQAKEQCMEV